ncbi:Xanthine/uracil permease protein [Pseudomonas syringae pv. atrofaciens]|nr:Xanthine/uracil permease protein [Pseudomonas syringae pv. atrofaciens]
MGIASQPALLHQLPKLVQNLFDSAITSGGITAIVMCLLIPESKVAAATTDDVPEPEPVEQPR